LLEALFWRERQARIRQGVLDDVFPYPEAVRFRNLSEPVCLSDTASSQPENLS